MSAPDRERVKAVFAQVVDAPSASRPGLLRELCGDDDALRARVQSLLGADERAGDDGVGFLGAPAIAGAAEVARQAADAAVEPVGEVGAYTIVGKIGEGGMGAVYEATQRSPHRSVALKLIRAGGATPALQRRMRREVEALGRLSHPGIARVYEAGSAPVTYSNGAHATQPYIAMELVRGKTLRRYADAHDLDDRARLELLAHIAEAVQYAHQKGVIHRDLKPGNILVTQEGRAKILDFGVARIVDNDQEMSVAQTMQGQLIGTLAYMSPEQIAGDPEKIDTRCDVYSLGVIGYELLSGKAPLDVGSTSIAQAARIIAEVEPRSLGVATPRLRGDVSTIIDKALAKNPDERYQSAAELGADIRRFLRDQPITARPPSTLYVVRKFAKRNKALVVGVCGIAVALIAGTVVASILAVQANRARVIAEREALRSETAAGFMRQMLGSVSPGVARQNDTTLLRRILDDTAARLDGGELSSEPLVEAELRETLASTYHAIGLYDPALSAQDRAIALYERAAGPTDRHTLRARFDRIGILMAQGRFTEAEPELLQLRAAHRAAPETDVGDRASVSATLGSLYSQSGRFEMAVAPLEESLRLRTDEFGERSPQALSAMNSVAGAYAELGRTDDAISLYEQVVETTRENTGDDHPSLAIALNNLAIAYRNAGRLSDAESSIRQALTIQRAVLGDSHPSLGMSTHTLASLLKDEGDLEDAETNFREALRIFQAALPAGHWFIAQARADVASCMAERGEFVAAEAMMLQSYDEFEASLGTDSARTKSMAGMVADFYDGWNEAEQSEERAAEAQRWGALSAN